MNEKGLKISEVMCGKNGEIEIDGEVFIVKEVVKRLKLIDERMIGILIKINDEEKNELNSIEEKEKLESRVGKRMWGEIKKGIVEWNILIEGNWFGGRVIVGIEMKKRLGWEKEKKRKGNEGDNEKKVEKDMRIKKMRERVWEKEEKGGIEGMVKKKNDEREWEENKKIEEREEESLRRGMEGEDGGDDRRKKIEEKKNKKRELWMDKKERGKSGEKDEGGKDGMEKKCNKRRKKIGGEGINRKIIEDER